MNENFPDKVLDEMSFLFFDVWAQIMLRAILHHYVNGLVIDEWIEVPHYKMIIKASHQVDLHQRVNRICLLLGWGVDHLDYVALVSEECALFGAFWGGHVNAFGSHVKFSAQTP